MVLMAFLAVLREGIETVVFLLAVFNTSHSGAGAPIGVVLGLVVAIGLGYGIYRGGVRLNLSKFFRATGLVLVFVAAGLVVNALHTAHEAGWLNVGQSSTVDLTWLVRPGSVQSSLLTGMLGVQPKPVVIEVIGWLVYLIPVGLFVAWPPGRAVARRTVARVLVVAGGVLAIGAAILALAAPDRPSQPAATPAGDGASASVVSVNDARIVIRTADRAVPGAPVQVLSLASGSSVLVHGVAADVYVHTASGAATATLPKQISYSDAATWNGGHLPIGTHPTPGGLASVAYSDALTVTAWLEPRTQRILKLAWTGKVTAALVQPGGAVLPLSGPVPGATTTVSTTSAQVLHAARAAGADIATIDRQEALVDAAWVAAVAALVALLAAGGYAARRREHDDQITSATPEVALVNS
jgi:high-affinity iron transporter